MTDRVLVVGNSSIDNVISADLRFHSRVCGGNSFHASMAASRISDEVAILTVVPKNFPKRYIEDLKQHSIDVSAIERVDRDIELEELFIYEQNGDRRDGIFLSLYDIPETEYVSAEQRELLASKTYSEVYSFSDFHRDYIPDFDRIPKDWNIKAVHLAPTDYSVHKKIANLDGVKIKTLDPGRYLIDMSYGQILDLVARVTVFLPSKKEMNYIFPGMDLKKATVKLGREASTNIVCKNGSEGCFVYEYGSDSLFKVGTFESLALDPTGAGDSFCGALTASFATGVSMLDSVRMASVVAAKAIETISATSRHKIGKEFVMEHFSSVTCNREVIDERN